MKMHEKSLTENLYIHAKTRIPGGTQLLSKRPEMMAPGQWPAYYSRAEGCEITDLDGRRYYDMTTNGIGSCLLGFNDPDVTRAVKDCIDKGNMCTLNPPEEVYLADKLCEIHEWAQQARFTRCGGEAAAVAVRIARATTGRSCVAVCGYHGWQDWYIACNLGESDALRGHLLPGLQPTGVPDELRNTTFAFAYNNSDEFEAILKNHGENLAAVVMEPCRYNNPEPGFIEFVRKKTREQGIILIFDEITIGWRLNFGGAHLKLGIMPDMAIFAKALGNGHPIGAVIGAEAAMDGANESFISSTYWTERTGPTAALAVLNKMEKINVPAHIEKIGAATRNLWKTYSVKHGVEIEIPEGYPCLARFLLANDSSNAAKTLFTQLMLEKGFLAGTVIYPTLAHNKHILDLYETALDETFSELSSHIKNHTVEKALNGPKAQSGFRRLL